MPRFISTGNYNADTYPLKSILDTATAMTDGATYAASCFKSGMTVRLLKVMRLDAGTTADVITIVDPAGAPLDLVLARTGAATGVQPQWDFGPIGVRLTGGFGINISSGGTAGTYLYIFDLQPDLG